MATLRKRSHTLDTLLQLKDAGLIASDTDFTTVGGSDAIIDLGEGRVIANLVIEATAVEVDTGDEAYQICLNFSSTSDFSSDVKVGPVFTLGDAAAIATLYPTQATDNDNGVGRYEVLFTNVFDDTSYRYMSLSVEVVGIIATGVNFQAYVYYE